MARITVTAFIDASHCCKTKAAGWGMVLLTSPKDPGATYGGALCLQGDSHDAEQTALVNGVTTLIEEADICGKHVVVYADTEPDDRCGLTARLMSHGASSARIDYQRAHQGARGALAGLHERADRVAKQFMRESRDSRLA